MQQYVIFNVLKEYCILKEDKKKNCSGYGHSIIPENWTSGVIKPIFKN
jgi:hypothetical protein